MNCNYKVKITDIQTKYKFKVFCTGYDDSEIKEKIDTMYEAWPKASGEGETVTLDNTANATMSIDLKGNTSQDGTPTPDAPVDVSVVSGDNTIKVEGKNLFDNSLIISFTPTNTNWYSLDGISLFYNSTNIIRSNCYFDFKAGITYTISVYNLINLSNMSICKLDGSSLLPSSFIGYINFTPQEDIRGWFRSKPNNSNVLTKATIQIEKGTQATAYEPYQSQSYAVNLGTIELCKIGDYQDYIYKSENKWYKYAEIGKYIYNNDLTFNSQSENAFSFLTPALNVGGNLSASSLSNMSLCNMMQTSVVDYNGLNGTTSTNKIRINISKSIVTTQEEAFQLFSTNNLTIYYALQTPTTEEITDATLISQLETLKEAESYSGQTNISQANNDKSFIITAKALKDLSNLGTSTVSTLNTANVNRSVFNQSIDPANLEMNSEDLELNNEEEIIEETPEER